MNPMLRPIVCTGDLSLLHGDDAPRAREWVHREIARELAEHRPDVVCVQDRGGPDDWVAAIARATPLLVWQTASGRVLRRDPRELMGRPMTHWTHDVNSIPLRQRSAAVVESLVYYVHVRLAEASRPRVLYFRDARTGMTRAPRGIALYEQARTHLRGASAAVLEWRGTQ